MTYSTIADLRGLDGLDDAVIYPDAMLQAGADYSAAVIDDFTGTSWSPVDLSLSLDGRGRDYLVTGRPFLSAVVSCSIGGEAVADVSGWTARRDGLVFRDSGSFPASRAGQNVALVVTQDISQYPEGAGAAADIKFCSDAIARQYVLRLLSESPDGALAIQNELGTVMMAQAGGRHGVTSMPEVNARLMRRRHRGPTAS